ncbi:MAG: potassium-transporting ATPase subunit F [Acidobacteria bacterium]|nr:potassium-transporting ATPase subunit F [Acidobacteriota bacterium]
MRAKEHPVDYLIAGLCALLLFFYLIYALLKPERL